MLLKFLEEIPSKKSISPPSWSLGRFSLFRPIFSSRPLLLLPARALHAPSKRGSASRVSFLYLSLSLSISLHLSYSSNSSPRRRFPPPQFEFARRFPARALAARSPPRQPRHRPCPRCRPAPLLCTHASKGESQRLASPLFLLRLFPEAAWSKLPFSPSFFPFFSPEPTPCLHRLASSASSPCPTLTTPSRASPCSWFDSHRTIHRLHRPTHPRHPPFRAAHENADVASERRPSASSHAPPNRP